jgi:hypothetical protein
MTTRSKYKHLERDLLEEDGLFDIPDDPWDVKDMCESVKKKKKNGKRKGNGYERVVAKDLSTRFNDTFRRVPQSGAFVGGLNRHKNRNLREDAQEILAGDIICPKWFPFSVECKNWDHNPKLHNICSIGDKELDNWIKQAKGQAEVSGKDWIICFKVTEYRGKEFVVMDQKVFNKHVPIDCNYPDRFFVYRGTMVLDYKLFFENYFNCFGGKLTEDNQVESKIDIDSIDVENIIEQSV